MTLPVKPTPPLPLPPSHAASPPTHPVERNSELKHLVTKELTSARTDGRNSGLTGLVTTKLTGDTRDPLLYAHARRGGIGRGKLELIRMYYVNLWIIESIKPVYPLPGGKGSVNV